MANGKQPGPIKRLQVIINGPTVYDLVHYLTIFHVHGTSKMSNLLSGGGYMTDHFASIRSFRQTHTPCDLDSDSDWESEQCRGTKLGPGHKIWLPYSMGPWHVKLSTGPVEIRGKYLITPRETDQKIIQFLRRGK